MNYRLPSFMKDGDDILWVMRRLDYLLRLWMNRTGDQVLVGQTQDGTAFDLGGGKFDFMPTLERILNKFDGGSSLTTNKNIITYMLASESGGANPYNKVLKSGAIPHADEQSSDINAILNTTMGDTHLGAIKALERCAWNILQYIIGVDAYRSWLRDIDNSQNPLGMFTDLPVNIPVQPSSFSGNMSTAYIPNSSTIVPAIRELVLRSERNVGTNFLINSSFWAVNSQNNLEGWSSTLSRSQLAGDVYCATGTLGNSGSFGQNVNLGGIVAGILAAAGNIVSASMLVRNQHSMTLRIRIFAENGSQLSGASVEVPAAEYPRTVSLSAKATLESARSIEVDLVNTSGQAATVTIYGVSLNAGMPNAAPASRANVDFLSRWGGTEAKLWGNLYLDNHHIFTGGGKIDTGGGQVITRGGVIYTRDPDTVPGAGQTNGGTIYTGGSQIHGETKNAEATAPYDFVTLSQLRGFTISIGGSGTQDVVVNGSTLTNYNEFRNVEITESTADGFRFPGLTIIRATGNVLFSGNVRVGDPAGGALGHRYSSMEKYPNGSFADNLTDPAVWAPPPYVHRTRDAWGLYYSIGPNNLKILVRKADNGDSFDREINTKVYMPGWRPFRVAGGNYDAKKCRNLANLIELSLKNKSGCGGGGGGGTGRGKRYADYHGYDDVDPLTDVMGAYGGQGMGGGRVGQPKYTNSFNYIGFGGLGVPGITYGDATAAFTIALGGRGGDGSTSGNGALGGLGGAGGGSLVVLADGDITVNPGVLLDASGWAGNSGAFDGTYYGGSGGGGGGGQVILVSMGDIYLTNASLSACGASGGYTAPSTGGGGGGGALVALAQGTVFSDGCSLFYNGGQSPSDPGQEGSYDFVSDYAVWNFPFGTRAISS
jgi:hypothetical protein